jgi:GNAT superfamily N-acetyltransferase
MNDSEPVSIRRAQIKDAQQIAALIRRFARKPGQKADPNEDVFWHGYSEKYARRELSRPDFITFVATRGRLVEGFIELERRAQLLSRYTGKPLLEEPVSICHAIAVCRPGNGIGRMLYQKAADWAREQEGAQLATYILNPKQRSRSLLAHRALGFDVVEEYNPTNKQRQQNEPPGFHAVTLLRCPGRGLLGGGSVLNQHPIFSAEEPQRKPSGRRDAMERAG